MMLTSTKLRTQPRCQQRVRTIARSGNGIQTKPDLNKGIPPPPPLKGMRSRDELDFDQDKEISRRYRRAVYDFEYWASHRSTKRYAKHIASMPSSRIIRSLFPPTGWTVGCAALVCYDHELVKQGILSKSFEFISLDLAPISITSFALSLLLVFRTNSSYGRFDEARKFWGLALNRSRDIVRQAVTYFPMSNNPGMSQHITAKMARWTIAWTIALKCHLRPNENLRQEAQAVLSEDELALLMSSDHKVLLCFQVMTHIIEEAGINDIQALQMQQNITTYEDILGGCERLLRTPLPISYTRHTSRFLLIWLTILPLALYGKLGWATVPAVGLISLLLLGIEEIGVEIEEPFGILPLEAIAGKANADIVETINGTGTVKDVALRDRNAQREMNNSVFKLQNTSNRSASRG